MLKIVISLALIAGCLTQEASDRGSFGRQQNGWGRPQNKPQRPYAKPQSYTPEDNYEPFIFEGDGGGDRDSSPMKTLYSWKQLDFTFPNDNVRQQMIRNQEFIPINTMILDSDVYGEFQIVPKNDQQL